MNIKVRSLLGSYIRMRNHSSTFLSTHTNFKMVFKESFANFLSIFKVAPIFFIEDSVGTRMTTQNSTYRSDLFK